MVRVSRIRWLRGAGSDPGCGEKCKPRCGDVPFPLRTMCTYAAPRFALVLQDKEGELCKMR